jgi:nucleotide-binding universal stress UspA family protein
MRFGRVLIALDHDESAANTAKVGIELAGRLQADAALVHAVDPELPHLPESGDHPAMLIARAMVEGRSLLEKVAKHAKLPSAPIEFVPVGHPTTEIVKTAAGWKAEILVRF